jgi:hypothetical protein
MLSKLAAAGNHLQFLLRLHGEIKFAVSGLVEGCDEATRIDFLSVRPQSPA